MEGDSEDKEWKQDRKRISLLHKTERLEKSGPKN